MPCHPAAAGPRRRSRGFTLVELVVVMLLVAIIAGVGASRLASREPFAVQGAADQIVSGLRLAQVQAVARRAPLYVRLDASPAALSVCLDAGCAQPLTSPSGGPWLDGNDGVALAAALAFSFDAAGVPSLATTATVQVAAGDGTHRRRADPHRSRQRPCPQPLTRRGRGTGPGTGTRRHRHTGTRRHRGPGPRHAVGRTSAG